MNLEVLIYMHNRISLGQKKNKIMIFSWKMDATGDYYVNKNKPT